MNAHLSKPINNGKLFAAPESLIGQRMSGDPGAALVSGEQAGTGGCSPCTRITSIN